MSYKQQSAVESKLAVVTWTSCTAAIPFPLYAKTMTPLIKVHRKYSVNKPIKELADYFMTLEEHRKPFEADMHGGLVHAEPLTFVFTIPIIAYTRIRTRTLLQVTLYPKADKTALMVTLTPNIAFLILCLAGVLYTIVALIKSDSTDALLKGIGIGVFIIALGCMLDIISKKVVLGTFERCLNDIYKRRTTLA